MTEAQPPEHEQPAAAEAGSTPGQGAEAPPPVFGTRVFLRAGGVAEELAGRLLEAFSPPGGSPWLAFCGEVEPVGVRSGEPSAKTIPARLVLPDGVGERVGERIETRVVVDGSKVRVWLAGVDRIAVGSTVLMAVGGESGHPVTATAPVEDSSSPIALSAPWTADEPPTAIAIGVVAAGD